MAIAKKQCVECKEHRPVTIFHPGATVCMRCNPTNNVDNMKASKKEIDEARRAHIAEINQHQRRKITGDGERQKPAAPTSQKKQQAYVSEQSQKAKAEKKEQKKQESIQEKAQRELARRELARRHLLPFVQYFNDTYLPGWVHKDICLRLEQFFQDVIDGKSPRLMLFMPPRSGKLLSDDTLVPTPNGLKRHGDLVPGDYVFGSNGHPTKVIAVSPHKLAVTHRMEFSDGGYVDCHADHEWTVFDKKHRLFATLETKFFEEPTRFNPKRLLTYRQRPLYELPAVKPLQYAQDESQSTGDYYTKGKTGALDKNIEQTSINQRLAYLAGVIDRDDFNVKNGSIYYGKFNEPAGATVLKSIVQSLGGEAVVTMVGNKTSVDFHLGQRSMDLEPFICRNHKSPERARNINAVGISRVTQLTGELESGQCIQVEAKDGLYVVDNHSSYILTHNSELVSRAFPAWALGHKPNLEFIATSYGSDLAMDFSRKVRDVITSVEYKRIFPDTRIAKDARSVEKWKTEVDGSYVAAGVGGPITGRGAHIGVIDDPLKNREEAESPGTRQKIRDWYTSTLYTRLAPGGGLLLVMCMSGDTQVTMADGSWKPLREIVPGDIVMSYNDGVASPQPVLNHINHGPDEVFEIRTGNSCVKANARHPFLVERPNGVREWVRVRDLNVGDKLVELNRRNHKEFVANSSIRSITPAGTEDVFDIQVANTENFIADGLVSHNTRWHDDDLAGWLEKEAREGGDQWDVISYPAIAEQDEKYRLAGEALHPERYPVEALTRIRRAIGERDWASMYQQNPVPDEGAYFQKPWFKYYAQKDLPPMETLSIYQAWDFAIGQNETNDYTVGVTVGIDRDDNAYVLNVVRGRWDSLEIVDNMMEQAIAFNPQFIGAENGQIELAIGPLIKKRMAETGRYFAIHPLKTGRRDKQARARPLQGRLQQGKVLLPKDAEWSTTLKSELLRFPAGANDDQVDALAWCFQMLQLFSPTVERKIKPKKSWKDNLHKYVKHGKRRKNHMTS